MTDSKLPKSVFRDRLRTYLFGVGIGLILVGFIAMERYRRYNLRQQAGAGQVESSGSAGGSPDGSQQPAGKP